MVEGKWERENWYGWKMHRMINGSWKLTRPVLGCAVASPTIRNKFFLVACTAAFENRQLLYNEQDKLKWTTKNILQLSLQVIGYNTSVEWEVLTFRHHASYM